MTMNEVWILEAGCIYEGGHVIAAYATEEAGLKAAEEYMAKEVERTAGVSTPDDPCETNFEKSETRPDLHYWLEHYKWSYKSEDGILHWCDGASDFLSLRKLWLNK